MKRWLIVLAAALLVFPAAGFAAVQGSLHDMDNYTGTEGKVGGACAYCHIPHGAAGNKLYKDSITAAAGENWKEASQQVSLICGTCHNASGGGIILTDSRTVAMFNDNAHLFTIANMTAWGDNANLAGVRRSTDGTLLECSSCHDPHATTTRPFLKYSATGGDIHGNCKTCHVNRNNETVGGTGNHLAWTDGSSNSGYASQHPTNKNMSGDNPSDEVETWGTINDAFNNPAIATASPTTTPATTAGTWFSRGKFNTTATGTSGVVGCQTCHAVHGVESAATGGTVTFHNQTQKGTGVVVLAMNATRTSSSAFCQGCHNTTVVTGTAAKHPVNTVETNWNVDVQVSGTTYAQYWTWPVQGSDYTIVCETCHDVHYGSDNTAILRKQAGNLAANGGLDNQHAADYGSVGAFCNECHGSSPAKTVSFASGTHHPISYQKDGVTRLALDFDPAGGSNIYRDSAPATLNHSTIAWDTRTRTADSNPYTFGTLSGDTVMVCGTCHGNTAAAGAEAHPLAFPLDTNTESEMCVDCHTFNPSAFVLDYEKTASPALNDNSLMTHFVGHFSSAGKAGAPAQDGTGGYKRTTAWTGGPAAPKYSSDGTNTSIICESCHYWKAGNVSAVNAGSLAHNQAIAQDNVNGMLAPAGNNYDGTAWEAYLCSGCHGQAPGGGSSHPTQPNSTAPSNQTASSGVQTSISSTQGAAGIGHATLNSANKVNCESCHRPHNATQGTGALILEANMFGVPATDSNKPAFQLMADNQAGTTWLNQEGVCQRCHIQGQ